MRRSISSLLVAFALTALLPLITTAQTKVAYLDATKILKRMPEATDAQSRLDQLASGWNHDAEDMQNELNRKQADFDRRKLIMTDAERTAAEVDLQSIRKRLDDFRHSKYDTPNGELFTQEAQLMKPAYEKLSKAIEEAAREGSFDYVLDRSSRDVAILYSNSKYDLTIIVARKLGIETDILSTPLINGAPKSSTVPPNGQPTNNQFPQQVPNPALNPGNSNPPPTFNSGGNNPGQTPQTPQKNPPTPSPVVH